MGKNTETESITAQILSSTEVAETNNESGFTGRNKVRQETKRAVSTSIDDSWKKVKMYHETSIKCKGHADTLRAFQLYNNNHQQSRRNNFNKQNARTEMERVYSGSAGPFKRHQ